MATGSRTGHGSVLALAALLATAASPAPGQPVYRYRDERGQWVYTDRDPGARADLPMRRADGGAASPRMLVQPRSGPAGIALVAVNECHCVVEFAVKAAVPGGRERSARALVAAQTEQVLLEIEAPPRAGDIHFDYGFVIGDPAALHRPPRPYRAPFATAASFEVTQAAPDAVTHRDVASRHAVDIAMPVGTAVLAAREGMVINVAHRFFRSGTAKELGGEANFVQVLHDDGTTALYAHLQLDTVRVRPGQRVGRGEHIANSGNTGYSSGPHLHFVVLRNAGLRSESVPVAFAGAAGAAVTPRTGQPLTAY